MRRTSSPFDSAVVNVQATPVSAQSSPLLTLLPFQPLIITTPIYAQGEPWCGRPSTRSRLVAGCAADWASKAPLVVGQRLFQINVLNYHSFKLKWLRKW
eukprot:2310790-Amphidinium_carterae.1